MTRRPTAAWGRFQRRMAVGLAVMAVAAGACGAPGASSGPAPASRQLRVVAAENFWGSLARQLGGDRVSVSSIVTNANADPHEYESSSGDARLFAAADYVVVNGAGYDSWADKLLAANPVPSRRVLSVARLLGKTAGDNPHFWYDPAFVNAVVQRVSADYERIDPSHAAYFRDRLAATEAALSPYQSTIASMRSRFAGTPVAATEDVFSYLSQALGLDLLSPPAFMQAVAEGNDPPVASVRQLEDQISQRRVSLLVYNSQTTSRLTSAVRAMAVASGIPVVAVTETVEPSGLSFEQWQLRQLSELSDALARAGGRRS
jgi:zinc/manganese transport system substrate-binding protein